MQQKLDEILSELRRLLETESLSPDQLSELRTKLGDIQTSLVPSQVDEVPNTASARQSMDELMTSFEGAHPQLTNALGRIADLLSQIGI